ncbi:MAG: UDPGP type 1 family protein [Phycisphaerales bacterium]|nr:UDPGP type 1 family protein [Phycisphaerales bacterium]
MTADFSRPSLESRYREAVDRLEVFGQSHILTFWDGLTEGQRENLLAQCRELPLELLQREITSWRIGQGSPRKSLGEIEPAHVVGRDVQDRAHYRAIGERMIRDGRVACFTVAGGQSTRLGWNGPKGTFPTTPLLGKSLFEVFAESIRAARLRWRGAIPWYVMTSPLNHAATEVYFREHDWFQLGRETVWFFPQGTLPSLSHDGKILLAAPDAIALNPDGHGGAVRALATSGSLAQMKREGVDTISYFQVDNPLVHAVDPLFLGLHMEHPESSAEISSKFVPKRSASEKVGVFCRRNQRTLVLEYSDLPADLAAATRSDGELLHGAGSIAIHALSRAFVEQLAMEGRGLPLHRALKKVPCLDLVSGLLVEPAQPNAVKMEAFIFDAVPIAGRSLVYETRREEEFAPIKNADGEDSAATSRTAQSERAARWLESCGVSVARSSATGACMATIELSPLTALDETELALRTDLPRVIAADAEIVL